MCRQRLSDAELSAYAATLLPQNALSQPVCEFSGGMKRRLMIAVGCTGGAHRSVAISEALGAHLRALGQTVSVTHRDISIEEASWPFRRVK